MRNEVKNYENKKRHLFLHLNLSTCSVLFHTSNKEQRKRKENKQIMYFYNFKLSHLINSF